MTPDEFQSVVRDLPAPAAPGELEAREVTSSSGVWIARDHADRQHLLVQVPDGTELDLPGTHGLGVQVIRHRVPGRPDAAYIDLSCLDPAVSATFAAVAADIANQAVRAGPRSRLSDVASALNEWRWFWGVDPAHLSASDALGLFGELWFMIQWAGVSAGTVRAWNASAGSRHDFQWPDYSVEVKATSRSGPAVHTIQNLEQLEDAEHGTLYLYSLRVARDALAANTVASLVEVAVNALGDHAEARTDLLRKLSRRGYTPAERNQAVVPYRVIEQGLYTVTAGFPRLTHASFAAGLPAGIAGVSYQIQMAACHEWLAGTDAESWPPSPTLLANPARSGSTANVGCGDAERSVAGDDNHRPASSCRLTQNRALSRPRRPRSAASRRAQIAVPWREVTWQAS